VNHAYQGGGNEAGSSADDVASEKPFGERFATWTDSVLMLDSVRLI